MIKYSSGKRSFWHMNWLWWKITVWSLLIYFSFQIMFSLLSHIFWLKLKYSLLNSRCYSFGQRKPLLCFFILHHTRRGHLEEWKTLDASSSLNERYFGVWIQSFENIFLNASVLENNRKKCESSSHRGHDQSCPFTNWKDVNALSYAFQDEFFPGFLLAFFSSNFNPRLLVLSADMHLEEYSLGHTIHDFGLLLSHWLVML